MSSKMWKKIHKPRDASSLKISAPTLSDDDRLEAIQKARAAHPKPESYDDQQLPDFPSNYAVPNLPPDSVVAHRRGPSSVYSTNEPHLRHPPNPLRLHTPQNTNSHYSAYRDSQYTDVSPPVSPVYEDFSASRGSHEVSPIDETPNTYQFPPPQDSQVVSNIPVSQKPINSEETKATRYGLGGIQSSPSSKNATPARETPPQTKWDDYSGEPTTSDQGKHPQSTPGNPTFQEREKPKSSQKSQYRFLGKDKGSQQSRLNVLKTRRQPDPNDPAQLPPPRAPWKGASGRAAIVNPIEAKKKKAKTPTPKPRVESRQGMSQRPLHGPVDTGDPMVALSMLSDFKDLPEEPTAKPVVPLKDDGANSGSGTPVGPSTKSGRNTIKGSDQLTAEKRENTREFQPNTHGDRYGKQENMPGPDLSHRFQQLDMNQQPSSRFSMTTYATTEAGSPPRSPIADDDAPPVPEISSQMQDLAARAVKSTTRKPTASQISSTLKTLPQSPPEMAAGNRIDALEAKLKDLGRRRGNIGTIIHELTQVIQPSSIAYDMATRSEVTKTVDSLNNELADIKKEEHEIGLKLLRAYKKKDEGDCYAEPSGLWIRRVTG